VRIQFPIVTTPKRDDFLRKLQLLVDSDFEELVLIAPFVDGQLMQNLLKRFPFGGRRLTIVTRYGDLFKDQKRSLQAAVVALARQAKKDPTLAERIKWYVNNHVHAKLFILDWSSALFGSQNLTYAALKVNYEVGAYLADIANVKNALEAFVKDVIKNSSKVLFPVEV
jgi:phosphatidylserine/phosphatidylglycerophosphate/cardiolipin synthase-like enzyme